MFIKFLNTIAIMIGLVTFLINIEFFLIWLILMMILILQIIVNDKNLSHYEFYQDMKETFFDIKEDWKTIGAYISGTIVLFGLIITLQILSEKQLYTIADDKRVSCSFLENINGVTKLSFCNDNNVYYGYKVISKKGE